jgi:hypothetical protein
VDIPCGHDNQLITCSKQGEQNPLCSPALSSLKGMITSLTGEVRMHQQPG